MTNLSKPNFQLTCRKTMHHMTISQGTLVTEYIKYLKGTKIVVVVLFLPANVL